MTGPWMLGLSLWLPPTAPAAQAGLVETFRRFGAACRDALGELGIGSALASNADVARSIERARLADLRWACFGTVSHGELVDRAGRKLLGLAQSRRRGCVLLEGGLLLCEPDWALLCELFGKPAQSGLVLRDVTAALAHRHGREFDLEAFRAGLRRGVARHGLASASVDVPFLPQLAERKPLAAVQGADR
jgi:lipoate-protein ligase A